MKNRQMTYELPADVEHLEEAIQPILSALEEKGADQKTIYQMHLVMEELVSNVAFYAYAPGKGEVTISYEIEEEPRSITVTILDRGKPFDPTSLEEPELTAAAEDRAIGGLGLFLVKNMMDEIAYRREEDKNILTAKKLF